MPAKDPCPKCRGRFVELDRNGIKIDVCQECRGVFLDRGELDLIIAAEQRAVSSVYDEDESFFRQLAGQPSQPSQPAPPAQPTYSPPPAQPQHSAPPAQPTYSPPPPQPPHSAPPAQPAYSPPPPQPAYGQHAHGGRPHHQQYGFDVKTAERLLGDFRSHQSSHKKKHQKSLLQQLFD